MVEIELPTIPWPYVLLVLVVCLFAFAILGAAVTPAGAQAQVMTPDRWTAFALARQARTETEALLTDAGALRAMLEQDRPDPVAAMLLAERLYARHNQGTSATGGARQALITAAEATARFAVGELPRQAAAEDFNVASSLIETLVKAPPSSAMAPPPARDAISPPILAQQVFLPYIQTPSRLPTEQGRRVLVTTLPVP